MPSRRRDCHSTNLSKPALSLAPHHVLASLVKGRWIDGITQTFALLLSAGDTPAFSIYQTFLPSRRRDCFTPIEPLYPHNLLKSTSTASPRTKLASPRKRGGGLTALQNRYSISSSFCNLPDCFQNCYTFCRQDGGDCVCLEDLKIVFLSISIPTVTARNSFRIVKAGLSEYCTASQKNLSAVPPPLFRGEARKDCDLCYFLHNLYTFWYVIFFRCHFGRVVKP